MNETRVRFKAGGTNSRATKFWNVLDTGAESGELTLYGDICDKPPVDNWTGELSPGVYVTPEGFIEDLEKIKGKANITVKINSCGGDLYTGIGIHNALKGLTGKKIVKVEGIAASAASVIAMAGDEVQMYPGSIMMIHGVSADLSEAGALSISDLKKLERSYDANEKAIAEIYHAKTGLEVDKLRAMMAKETWFVGQEAVDNKFADALISDAEEGESEDEEDEEKKKPPVVEVENGKKILFIAGIKHDITAYKNVPKSFNAAQTAKPTDKTASALAESTEELKLLYPQLVAQIEKAAAENERARIKAIDELAKKPGAAALAYSAKYTDICNADQFAARVLKAQDDFNASRLKNITSDANDSGANNVGAGANSGGPGNNEDDEEEKASIGKVVNAVNKIRGGI